MYTPHFTITPSMNQNIAEIERLRVQVEKSRILPAREVVLRQRASVESTRSSTGIEGNPLNYQEVALVLSGKKISASDRFVTEVLNYKKALVYIEKQARLEHSFTFKNVLNVHRLVMTGLLPATKVGKIRKTGIFVVDINRGEEVVRYTGPEASSVADLISDLISWMISVRGKLHDLLVAGIVHYEFVSIHPFSDGNGRVVRLLTQQYFYQRGYGFRHVLVPDSYYFADRQKYYEALNQAPDYDRQRVADLTSWLEYFIEGLVNVARDVSEKITVVSVAADTKSITLTPEDYEILDCVSTFGSIKRESIIESVKISRRTLQRRLARLVEAHILKRSGRGPSTGYSVYSSYSGLQPGTGEKAD